MKIIGEDRPGSPGEGAVRNEIITIVDKNEYQKLMQYMSREDPAAFITVYNVSDMRYTPKNGVGM